MSTACRWMGLDLPSPFILASLTLFSHVEVKRHADYFAKCVQAGAGAVILPSTNPARQDVSGEQNHVKVRTAVVDSGLGGPMGFALLGPTVPNIIPVSYAVALAELLAQKHLGVPIIGSIVNLGSLEEFATALSQLVQSPVDGIELNFSCPNILRIEHNAQPSYEMLIQKAREICGPLPISLKLPPTVSIESIDRRVLATIQSLTLNNAHIGLLPPNIDTPEVSPFSGCGFWAPTGIYGPQERMLTYYALYRAHQLAIELNLDISCVGGIVNAEQAVQALLLGAATVQLSSAVVWKGIDSFRRFKSDLEQYLRSKNIDQIVELKGRSLPYILNDADQAKKDFGPAEKRYVTDCCCICEECVCTDRLCIAISRSSSSQRPQIDEALCSGCGWCENVCPHHAIVRRTDLN